MTPISRLGRRDLRNSPFWVLLLIEASAATYVGFSPQHWLRAVGIMAVGLGFAAASRLVLTDEQAGLLRVRKRGFDVACYVGASVLVITFGLALPQR